jgi:HD-GYP domain-containing protein (c-di-GMP phosphodiesterase class II)/CHASE2 domain-containing sensor protein
MAPELEAPQDVPDVAVVAIDAQSMRAFGGEWPWPRSRFAEVVRRLDAAGARAIAFDIDFSTQRDRAEDAAFARAIAESGRVVLSAHREFQLLPEAGELEIASFPDGTLSAGAAGIGAAIVEIDSDGLIRNAYRSRVIASHELPSLTEAALSLALGESPNAIDFAPFAIDYRRSRPSIPLISIVDVIEGRFDPARVAGRIVLVGATAVEFQDLWATPIGPNQPGVLIQAYAARTLAAQRAGEPALSSAGAGAQWLLVLVVSLVAAALGSTSHLRRLAGLGALSLALPTATLALLHTSAVLLDPVVPLAVVGAHYLLGLETVRRRLGQRLAERELSLSTLFTVGEATTTPSAENGIDVALALLGDVVSASGVGLLRTNQNGELDGARLEWRRRGDRPVGDIDTATLVLADRKTRIFEGTIPGRDALEGLAVYTPLFAGKSAVGVLVVEQDFASPLSDMQLRTIATVGTQLALSVENLRLYNSLQATFHSSISALASAVEARDGYTDMHCRRLSVFSVMMAERLGLNAEEIESIELGALLHDVGKIGIPDNILLKEARLDQAERTIIEKHSVIGHRIVEPINGMSATTIGCVRHHHERWNGTGYPDGLAGEDIPLGARIVSIVDVWDALSTDRPYKRAYPQQRVREILKKDSGVRFEPALVDLFLEILNERGEELLDLIAATTETRP